MTFWYDSGVTILANLDKLLVFTAFLLSLLWNESARSWSVIGFESITIFLSLRSKFETLLIGTCLSKTNIRALGSVCVKKECSPKWLVKNVGVWRSVPVADELLKKLSLYSPWFWVPFFRGETSLVWNLTFLEWDSEDLLSFSYSTLSFTFLNLLSFSWGCGVGFLIFLSNFSFLLPDFFLLDFSTHLFFGRASLTSEFTRLCAEWRPRLLIDVGMDEIAELAVN